MTLVSYTNVTTIFISVNVCNSSKLFLKLVESQFICSCVLVVEYDATIKSIQYKCLIINSFNFSLTFDTIALLRLDFGSFLISHTQGSKNFQIKKTTNNQK